MKKKIEKEKFSLEFDFDEKQNKFNKLTFKSKSLNELEKKILEQICILSPQLKLQEIYEHLIIRIENNFRDFNKISYSGVYFAENKFKEFVFFRQFVRELVREVSSDKFKKKINFQYIKPNHEWVSFSIEEKEKKIVEAFKKFEKNVLKKETKLEVLKIENNTDIYINLPELLSSDEKSSLCLKFEIFLKDNLDKSLLLYFQWKGDMNKLRRLKV